MGEWHADLLFRQISDELLIDPFPPAVDPLDLTTPASRPDGSWCEDRDPRADWELTDMDGRE